MIRRALHVFNPLGIAAFHMNLIAFIYVPNHTNTNQCFALGSIAHFTFCHPGNPTMDKWEYKLAFNIYGYHYRDAPKPKTKGTDQQRRISTPSKINQSTHCGLNYFRLETPLHFIGRKFAPRRGGGVWLMGQKTPRHLHRRVRNFRSVIVKAPATRRSLSAICLTAPQQRAFPDSRDSV